MYFAFKGRVGMFTQTPRGRIRLLWSTIVAGIVGGGVCMLFGTMLWPPVRLASVYAPLWGLPGLWAAAALYLLKPLVNDWDRQWTAAEFTFMFAFVATATTVAMAFGFIAEWLRMLATPGQKFNPMREHIKTAYAFFNCCGWPAGLICFGFILKDTSRRILRMILNVPPEE
jgi:hypothetical protein